MNTRIQKLFQDYSEYHAHPMNQRLHYFGVYSIVVSVLGLLAFATFGGSQFLDQLFRPDLGSVLVVIALMFYFYMDWKLAIPFTLVLMGCYFIGRSLSVEVLITVQILGWIIQYIGHLKFEKKAPAFYKNLTHLLIGPFWLFAKLIGYGRSPLQN
jgi:uncharacterized membrane protein YGL010W